MFIISYLSILSTDFDAVFTKMISRKCRYRCCK